MKQIMGCFRFSLFSFDELKNGRDGRWERMGERQVATNYTLDILILSDWIVNVDRICSSFRIINYWRARFINSEKLTLCHPRWVWFDFRHPFVVESMFCLACWSRYINVLLVGAVGVGARLTLRYCCFLYALNFMQKTFHEMRYFPQQYFFSLFFFCCFPCSLVVLYFPTGI